MPSGVTPAQKRYDVCGQLSLCERLPDKPMHSHAHLLRPSRQQSDPCAPTTGTDAEQRSAGLGLAACAQKPFVADGRAVGHDFPATTRRTCVDLQPADIASHFGHHSPTYGMGAGSTCLLAPIPFPRAVAITDHSSSSRHSRAELRPCVTRPLPSPIYRSGTRVRHCSKLVAEPVLCGLSH